MSSEDGGSGGFLTGLILGALVGAAAALLWSPRSGQENRGRLAEALPGLRNQGPEALEHAADEVKSRLDEGIDAFRRGAAEARERLARELDQTRRGEAGT